MRERRDNHLHWESLKPHELGPYRGIAGTLRDYTLDHAHDEMREPSGEGRPAFRALAETLARLSQEERAMQEFRQ